MRVSIQKIPKKQVKVEDTVARFCYHFPQYTYHYAFSKMPFRRLTEMLKVVDKERAAHYLNLTNIVAAPHTKKGAGVKKLMDRYEKVIGD